MAVRNVSADQAREERAYALGIQALLWARPLVLCYKTFFAGISAGAVGVSYYHYHTELKTAADRFVNTPNNVTIDGYCAAWLKSEPVVVKVPPIHDDRWYIVQVGDYFDEVVYNIGGSKGPEPGLFLVTGPDWHGQVPAGMREIRVRTQLAVVASRVFVSGQRDLPAARAVQAGLHALPLSVFQMQGLRYQPVPANPDDFAFKPAGANELKEFEIAGFCMQLLLSTSDDFVDPLVREFHHIGLSVMRGFAPASLDEATRRGLVRAVPAAQAIIDDAFANAAVIVDGWRYTMATGRAGFDLALRAAFASNVTGANVAEESLYPNCRVDHEGNALDGANQYVLHFEQAQLPPISVFWNLNMFDSDQFFIENDFGRYSIGSTTDGLKTNQDGSIDLLIQHERPADTSNWLPAPTGSFNLTMRLYGAQAPILNGTYHLPPVTKVQEARRH